MNIVCCCSPGFAESGFFYGLSWLQDCVFRLEACCRLANWLLKSGWHLPRTYAGSWRLRPGSSGCQCCFAESGLVCMRELVNVEKLVE